MRKEEFNDFMNFMLQMNIIDMNEYNSIMMKALPYLKK